MNIISIILGINVFIQYGVMIKLYKKIKEVEEQNW